MGCCVAGDGAAADGHRAIVEDAGTAVGAAYGFVAADGAAGDGQRGS